MADTKISALAAATLPLVGTELVPLVQAGATDRATAQDIANLGKTVSAASRLLGRGSAAGAGAQQEITLGTGLSMAATTLNVTGFGNAQTANPLSQFAATTSAQLAGVISDETGSGSLVFATSPTLINPAVGTQTAGDNTTLASSTAFVTAAVLAARSPNVQSVASAATVTPTFLNDIVEITAQAAALTLANPTGTAIDGLGMVIRIKDNATARAISYGTQYRAIGITLPTTTVISKTLYLAMIFNNTDTKWDVLAVGQEA